MKNLKTFFICGLFMMFINFIIINVLTLYYFINEINIDFNLKFFNISFFIFEVTPNSFGFTLMFAGMIASILIGGIVGLLFKLLLSKKKN